MNTQILKAGSKQGFYFLAGINRAVSPGHVTKLAESIDLMGMLGAIIVAELSFITGKKQLYIVDGQHKYSACIRNNVDVPYIVIQIKTHKELIEKIALLNASSKSWCLLDYITSWASISEDYKLSVVASILADKAVKSASGGTETISKEIKRGLFKIYDEIGAKKKLDCLTDVFKILPRMNRVENRYACSEYLNFLSKVGSKYDHSKFLAKLLKIKDSFVFATQEPGALETTFKQLL
jgi:hypothetical protein